MRYWIRRVTSAAPIAGFLLTLLGGLTLEMSLPTVIARALVVGMVVYMALALAGRLLARARPHLAIGDAAEGRNAPPAESHPGGDPAP